MGQSCPCVQIHPHKVRALPSRSTRPWTAPYSIALPYGHDRVLGRSGTLKELGASLTGSRIDLTFQDEGSSRDRATLRPKLTGATTCTPYQTVVWHSSRRGSPDTSPSRVRGCLRSTTAPSARCISVYVSFTDEWCSNNRHENLRGHPIQARGARDTHRRQTYTVHPLATPSASGTTKITRRQEKEDLRNLTDHNFNIPGNYF